MKRILFFVFIITIILPLTAIAEDESVPTSDAMLKTQEMLDSRVFLKDNGVIQMKEVSKDLSEESRVILYGNYRKNPAFGWLSFAVPSLGNWIVGDKIGGVISIVGEAGGLITFLVGYVQIIAYVVSLPKSTYYNSTTGSYYYRSEAYITMDTPGIITMLIGCGVMIGTYIYSPISAFMCANDYNEKLKAGLGIVYNDPVELNNKMIAESMNLPKALPELFHVNLLSYRF